MGDTVRYFGILGDAEGTVGYFVILDDTGGY